MHARESGGRERRGGDIILSPPLRAFHGDPARGQTIDGREGKRLCLAVVPAEAREQADVARDFLLDVHAGSIFEGSDPPRSGNVRGGSTLRGKTESLGVSAGVGVIQIFQKTNRPRMISDGIAA